MYESISYLGEAELKNASKSSIAFERSNANMGKSPHIIRKERTNRFYSRNVLSFLLVSVYSYEARFRSFLYV